MIKTSRRTGSAYPTRYWWTGIQYYPVAGRSLSYGYDSMGRLNSLTDTTDTAYPDVMVSGVTYNAAGQVTTASGYYW